MKKLCTLTSLIILGLSAIASYASSREDSLRNIAYVYGDSTDVLTLVSDGEEVATNVSHYIFAFLSSDTTSVDDFELDFGSSTNSAEIGTDVAAMFSTLQASGKKVMLSFGGGAMSGSDFWDTYATDTETLAEAIASFVKATPIEGTDDTFCFDGVDIDWEDTYASYDAAAFLYNLTKELRALLPSDEGFIISHAPQAGGYTAEKYEMVFPISYHYYSQALAYGAHDFKDSIDWLNVQFYNQLGYYEDGDVSGYTGVDTSGYVTQDGNWNTINDYIAIVECDTDWAGTGYDYGGLESNKVVLGKAISDGISGIPTDAASMVENLVDVLLNGGTTDASVSGYGTRFGGTFLWINLSNEDTVEDIVSWTDTLATAMPEDPWEQAIAAGPNAYYDQNLGFFYCNITDSLWTYSYVLGWMYPAGNYDLDLWLYVIEQDNWMYTNSEFAGYSYRVETGLWYYYDLDTNSFTAVE